MIELPEAVVLGRQIDAALSGKTVTAIFPPTYLHRFTFFNGDPAEYDGLLAGKKIVSAHGAGIFVDIIFEDDAILSLNDGVNVQYFVPGSAVPGKYQLLITLDDGSFVVFTVAMYGAIYAHTGLFDNEWYRKSMESVSPLGDEFDEAYFEKLIAGEKGNLTLKALLATKQRIPGLGNGVLQDILFRAGLHPKRKISTLTDLEKHRLFLSLKTTLKEMADGGGRDTEKDFYGHKGGYTTLLSRNTCDSPCPVCGGTIVKEAYMGGAVYFCPACQPLTK